MRKTGVSANKKESEYHPMQLHREATKLIEQVARLRETREDRAAQQRLFEVLSEQYGIWNGPEEGGRYYWHTRDGELIGPLEPQLADIKALAQQLAVRFTDSDQVGWFDLDKSEPQFEGTFQNSHAGIAAAYGALLRHQLTVQTIDEVHSQHAKRQQ
jgi:hypothetical protein